MKLDNHQTREFSNHWVDSYAVAEGTLVFIRDCNTDTRIFSANSYPADGRMVVKTYDFETIEYPKIKAGFYNCLDEGAVAFSRYPYQSVKRGLTTRNCNLSIPEIRGGVVVGTQIGHMATLNRCIPEIGRIALFNKGVDFPTLVSKLNNMLMGAQSSFALDQDYCFITTTRRDPRTGRVSAVIAICNTEVPIGRVTNLDRNHFSIKLNPLFSHVALAIGDIFNEKFKTAIDVYV